MQINEPLSGISQQRPTFTNIDNGIGIFTSRYNHYIDNLQLSEATHQGLSVELSELFDVSFSFSILKICSMLSDTLSCFFCCSMEPGTGNLS